MTGLLTLPQQTSRLPIPVIGYVRVSKAREEMISPQLQELSITEWAKRNNRELIDVVPDLDVSGRTWNRKIMRVIERIERGEAREVVVWKYSRFGRDMTGCAANLGRILRANGELQSATEDIDATTAVGQLSRHMLMAIAAFESERTSEGWHETWAWRLEHGLPPRGGPRVGYRLLGRLPDPLGQGTVRDPSAQELYVPDGRAVELLPAAYERWTSGDREGFWGVARMLNAAGVTTLRGNPWTNTGAKRLMDQGFAAGFLHEHDPKCTGPHDPDKRKACPNRIHLPGAHEAIIDLDLWEDYKERRQARASQPRGTRAAHHTYTGVIWCGHCKGRHSGAKRNGGVRYSCSTYSDHQRCEPRSVAEARITPVVLDMLAEYAERIDAQARAAERASEPAASGAAALEKDVEAEVARLDRRLSKLLDSHLDGVVSKEEYAAKRDELHRDKEKAAKRLKEAQAKAAAQERQRERVEVAVGLVAEWSTLPQDRRRELVRQVVERIDVFRESLDDARIRVRLHGGDERVVDVTADWHEVAANARSGLKRAAS